MNIQSILRFERGRLSKVAILVCFPVLMAFPVVIWADVFSGDLTITPADPIPAIPVGSPGIDLLAEWLVNKDVTRFEWLVNGSSQGLSNVATGEGLDGDETKNFTFVAPGEYEVCFHVYHHTQSDRTLTECVTVYVEDQACTWVPESAMSDGDDYPGANWFTYTPYNGVEAIVPLCAGSTCLDAGDVTFSDPLNNLVTITIELNSGWRFRDVEDNVKIQDYASSPTANAIPGQFSYKYDATTSSFTTDPAVPDNYYYGVHVDVERCELD